MRFFNTAGPVNPENHYTVTSRFRSGELDLLIQQQQYFILHAPRQTGKTSTIEHYVNQLNSEARFAALYVNLEAAQTARQNWKEGHRLILGFIRAALKKYGMMNAAITQFFDAIQANGAPFGSEFFELLTLISETSSKPVIVFFDEIDALIGDTLIGVLRQLRTGYINRPSAFPQSICLMGVRDVRDYRIWSEEENQMVLGGSAFNIKAESLRLEDFTCEQIQELLIQHTQETGQRFEAEAVSLIVDLTEGQPWLVNALAYEVCFRKYKDRSITITAAMIDEAREELIRRRDTHIDVLTDRLNEPRVKAIIQPILLGDADATQFPPDDVQYCIDLGLIKAGKYEIANPIYREVLPRALNYTTQMSITNHSSPMYVEPDGRLNAQKLMTAFQQFYRENADDFIAHAEYREYGPHLLVMAFLQRVVNGGGRIHREYALGRGRVDLHLEWKPANQHIVIELKRIREKDSVASIMTLGLRQTRDYMTIAGTNEGHLMIFDVRSNRTWEEKIWHKTEMVDSIAVHVWGL